MAFENDIGLLVADVGKYFLTLPWAVVFLIFPLLIIVICCFKTIKIKHSRKNTGFSQVVGLESVKEQLYREVIFPFYHAKDYKKFNLSLPNGILIYGPPGCGKTFIIERMAEEMGMNYIKLDHSELASPYIHETVKKIAEVFDWAAKNAPCLVFIDEIESLVPSRRNMTGSSANKHEEVNEFLLQLNNAGAKGIVVVGATNQLDLIDSAVMRAGRFDLKIQIPPPDLESRAALFKFEVNKMPHSKNIDFSALGQMTDGYACSDISSIVKIAARTAVFQDLKEIDQQLLETVISSTPSSLE